VGSQRKVAFLALAFGCFALALACGTFGAKSEQPPTIDGSVAPSDAGASDASPADPSDAAPDVLATDGRATCVNLMANAGFEEQSSCAPWVKHAGSASDGVPARSGAKACGSCADPGGTIYLLVDLAGHEFAPSERLHVEVWVRASDGGLVAAPARLYVGTNTTNAGDPARVYLSNDYQRLSADYTIPLEGGAVQIPFLGIAVSDGAGGSGGCILVDDVVACRPDGG
jgi:hypothetical protein